MSIFVFGYGSLMWNPGFEFSSARPALLEGWRRAWCVQSTFYRGCDDFPGYVLGLKKGGECVGMLFEVQAEHAAETVRGLDRREMRERGYVRQKLEVKTPDGHAEAYAYTSDELPDPCDRLFTEAYRKSLGAAGPNRDYVDRTCEFLANFEVPLTWPKPQTGLPCALERPLICV